MVRDMDLVREILLWVELFRPDIPGDKAFVELRVQDFPKRFQYMGDIQFLVLKNSLFKEELLETCTYEGVPFANLTWKGHDYLDEIRDPVWFEKLKKVLDPKQPYTLEYIRKVSKKLREASAQTTAFWLATVLNWIGFGILVAISNCFGFLRFW